MAIVFAGPFVNYLLGFGLFVAIFLVGAPTLGTKIGQVLEGYPAAEAGVRPGDRIQGINGRPVENWEEVTRAIHSQMTPVLLTVERDHQMLTLAVQPKVEVMANLLGSKVRVGMIGITPSEEILTRRYPFHLAVLKSADRVWTLTTLTLQAFWRILTGGLAIRESITGPIGIFHITSSAAAQGLVYLLQLIAVLSTSLGLFNLLPIPVLDGGHLAFLLLERIKGSPVNIRTQEMMTRVGLGLLMLLLVVVTYNDLIKFKLLR